MECRKPSAFLRNYRCVRARQQYHRACCGRAAAPWSCGHRVLASLAQVTNRIPPWTRRLSINSRETGGYRTWPPQKFQIFLPHCAAAINGEWRSCCVSSILTSALLGALTEGIASRVPGLKYRGPEPDISWEWGRYVGKNTYRMYGQEFVSEFLDHLGENGLDSLKELLEQQK